MESISSSGKSGKQTRLQEATEKRRAEEQLKQEAELKRQKKMFAPRKLIGPHDILVNSNLPKIKLEEDVVCCSTVKQEPLEVETISVGPIDGLTNSNDSNINLEVDSRLAENEADIEHKVNILDIDQYDNASVSATEEDMEISLSVEKETLEVKSTNAEVNSDFHEFIPSGELEADQNAVISKLDQNKCSSEMIDIQAQNHIKILISLNDQKDQEIKALLKVIKGLRHQLDILNDVTSDPDIENGQFNLIDSNINKSKVIKGSTSDSSKTMRKLTSDLMTKHAKIRVLSLKMLQLQDKLSGTVSYNLEISKNYKTSGEFVQESFKLVLPFLYFDFEVNDLLTCRMVCRSWRDSTDVFLSNHPSKLPFDQATHAEEKRMLVRGRMPKWNESPLQKLAKSYVFSNAGAFQGFTPEKRGLIIGSTVCLDNLLFPNKFTFTKASNFVKRFDPHIKYLSIRQVIDLRDFKIGFLFDRVKLCLSKLPSLQHFKLTLSIDTDKMERENGWDSLRAMGNMKHTTWGPNTFPQLEKLDSFEFELENWEGFTEHANFLERFSKCLVQPYSEQLKRLSIFTPGICSSDFFAFPKLVELSIPQSELLEIQSRFQDVEKCKITNYPSMVTPGMFRTIKKQFPKLICLGFKFDVVGNEFYHMLGRITPECPEPSFSKFSSVLTLELENCGAVTFTLLECFPNLSYIKLINKYTTNEREYSGNPVLDITKLWNGANLYDAKEFWDHFSNISLVTLEFSGEPETSFKPKLFTWTREGYVKWRCKNIQ